MDFRILSQAVNLYSLALIYLINMFYSTNIRGYLLRCTPIRKFHVDVLSFLDL